MFRLLMHRSGTTGELFSLFRVFIVVLVGITMLVGVICYLMLSWH